MNAKMIKLVNNMLLDTSRVMLTQAGCPDDVIQAFCDKALPQLIDLIESQYTPEELEQLMVWHDSPLGKKGIALAPLFMQEGERIGTKVMAEVMTQGL